jgi:hypothetical protein
VVNEEVELGEGSEAEEANLAGVGLDEIKTLTRLTFGGVAFKKGP